MSDISKLIPQSKFDTSGIKALESLEGEQVEPILAALLEWIQDLNWPVAQELVAILPRFHHQLVPHIRAVFRSDDAIWKNWTLVMIRRFPEETVKMLSADIKRMADTPTEAERLEETDGYASAIVKQFNLQ